MSAPLLPDPGPPHGPAASRRAAGPVRLLALAALVTTFVAGAALGWAGSRWARHRAPDGERRPAMRMGERFLEHLDLTPAQRASIDSILERRRRELDAFWAGPGQRLRLVVDSTRGEVRAVLTPAQRAVYDSIGEAHRRERERTGASPGFGRERPPPPPLP